MKKYGKQEKQSLATWAADCAERVLPVFEKAFPKDNRPRKAIEECRTWVNTCFFKMEVIRGASLSAHAAARDAKENKAASLAAHAAGQAVATAHVPQHAFGASYYALKAIAAGDLQKAWDKVTKELEWQIAHVSENLREEVQKRVIVQKDKDKVKVKILKDENF